MRQGFADKIGPCRDCVVSEPYAKPLLQVVRREIMCQNCREDWLSLAPRGPGHWNPKSQGGWLAWKAEMRWQIASLWCLEFELGFENQRRCFAYANRHVKEQKHVLLSSSTKRRKPSSSSCSMRMFFSMHRADIVSVRKIVLATCRGIWDRSLRRKSLYVLSQPRTSQAWALKQDKRQHGMHPWCGGGSVHGPRLIFNFSLPKSKKERWLVGPISNSALCTSLLFPST